MECNDVHLPKTTFEVLVLEYLRKMLNNLLQTHLSDSLYFCHTTFLTLPTSENQESPVVLICDVNVSDELKSLGVFFLFPTSQDKSAIG